MNRFMTNFVAITAYFSGMWIFGFYIACVRLNIYPAIIIYTPVFLLVIFVIHKTFLKLVAAKLSENASEELKFLTRILMLVLSLPVLSWFAAAIALAFKE